MSGRKSSEVLNVLANAKDIRDKVYNNTEKGIQANKKKNNEIDKEIREKKNKLVDPNIDIKNSEKYKKEIDTIVGNIKKIMDDKEMNEFIEIYKELEEYNSIKSEFSSIDQKSDQLRERVRYKIDYCNSEYAEANRLVQREKELESRMFDVAKLIADKVKKNGKYLDKINSYTEQLNNYVEQLNSIQIRITADNNVEELKKAFAKIKNEDAQKFENDSYITLDKELSSLLTNTPDVINKKATIFYERINSLNNIIIEKRLEFERKKALVEREIGNIKEIIERNSYEDLELANGTVISLFEFEDRFCHDSTKGKYEDLMRKINDNYEKEEFDVAITKLDELQTILENAEKKATTQYQKLLKEIDITKKIMNAVEDLGYDINAEFIDGDIRNGCMIEAIAGDEIINFDRIQYEDGEIKIDLDHQEGTVGTCENKMKSLMKSMQDAGIFITDITKNGRSVIYRDKAVGKENKNEVKTTRM